MGELLGRLEAANGVIGQADASMASAEASVVAAVAERQRAEEAAAEARAEAEELRGALADLQVVLAVQELEGIEKLSPTAAIVLSVVAVASTLSSA